MHNTALLAKEVGDLRAANEKKRQKRTRLNRQIAHEGSLTVQEGIELEKLLDQPVETVQHAQQERSEQPIQLVRRDRA